MDSLRSFDAVRLEVLRAVAAAGSLSGAARSLNYTVSAVSQQMATLEREADTPLLARTARGVQLTEAGRIMALHAEEVHASAGLARARLRSLSSLDSGLVRIGSVASFTANALPTLVRAVQARSPGLSFEVRSAKIGELARMLAACDIDLAIFWRYTTDSLAAEGSFELQPLFSDPLCVALPIGHELDGRATLSIREVGKGIILAPRHPHLLEAVQGRLQNRGHIQEFNDYQEAQGLVSAGLGVAILPQLVAETHRPDISIARLLEGEVPNREFFVALPTSVGPSPGTLATLVALRTYAAQMPGFPLATTPDRKG